MSSKGDHLDRTAENARESIISPATVIAIREESKTVKGLTLKIQDRKLTFKAGQWVDTMIPGVQTVGGFSMCSAPDRLSREGVLDLAVKYSDHPPAHWVHTQCSIGSQVAVRVGGDFYFDPKPSDPTRDLLLIAGGVGINPLYCIINHVTELNLKLKGDNSSKGDNSCYIPGKVLLLYSAGEKEELIFRDNLQKIVDFHENIQCRYFVTREQNQPGKDLECQEALVSSDKLARTPDQDSGAPANEVPETPTSGVTGGQGHSLYPRSPTDDFVDRLLQQSPESPRQESEIWTPYQSRNSQLGQDQQMYEEPMDAEVSPHSSRLSWKPAEENNETGTSSTDLQYLNIDLLTAQLKDYNVDLIFIDETSHKKTEEGRRITCEDISRSFDWLDKFHVTTYICGPSPMIEDMEKFLLHCGIDQNCIHYEKWW